MATAKLGIIVTEIAGTIGGVTFRRHRGTTVVGIKSVGGSKSILLQNPMLNNLRILVNNWGLLPVVTRDDWDTAALNFTFPDKFGDQRNLSGRELYLKLQGHLIVVAGAALDPTTLASAIDTDNITSLSVAMRGPNLVINGDFSIDANWSKQINWIIAGGFMFSNVNPHNTDFTQLNEAFRNEIASISYEISDWVSGGVKYNDGSGGFGVTNNANGTFNELLLISSNAISFGLRSTGVTELKIDNFIIRLNAMNSVLTFDNNFDSTVLIQAQILKNNAIAPTFTRRQIIAFKDMSASTVFDFSNELIEKFPEIKEGDLIRIYITYQNSSGFRTTPIVTETIVLD